MAAKLETTNTPGIYRRHAKDCDRRGRCECSYVIRYRDRGRPLMETFPTFAEAREGGPQTAATAPVVDLAEMAA